MTPPDLDRLLENDREWRRFIIERVLELTRDVADLKSSAFATRMVGAGVFALALVVVAWALSK